MARTEESLFRVFSTAVEEKVGDSQSQSDSRDPGQQDIQEIFDWLEIDLVPRMDPIIIAERDHSENF